MTNVTNRKEDVLDLVQTAEQLLDRAQVVFGELSTYSCVVHCHDRINGKLRKAETILSHFKKPNSIYLRWIKKPYKGLQASYVPTRDGPNKFQARETGLRGLTGTMKWPHDSPMIDKLYPHHFRTHQTSLKYLLELTVQITQRAIELEEFDVLQIREVRDEFLKRPATHVVCQLSDDPDHELRWPKSEFFFDLETELPLHFKLHDFDGGLFGEYAFLQFERDVDLPDSMFELKKLKK